MLVATALCVSSNLASRCNPVRNFKSCFSRQSPRVSWAGQTYSPDLGSGKILSGRWFGRITLRTVVPGNDSLGGGSANLLSGKWFRGNYSPGGGSAELLSGRWFGKLFSGEWFGRITLGKVIQRKILSGKWLGRITLGKLVRGNYHRNKRCACHGKPSQRQPMRRILEIARAKTRGDPRSPQKYCAVAKRTAERGSERAAERAIAERANRTRTRSRTRERGN